MKEQSYTLYILECADGTLYTGITTDVTARVHAHNDAASGARYTRSRRPVTLRYEEAQPDKSTALKREYEVKQLTRVQKLALIQGG